ncbi:hypothetical protein L195_g048925, partial [Trifolium pratense]
GASSALTLLALAGAIPLMVIVCSLWLPLMCPRKLLQP